MKNEYIDIYEYSVGVYIPWYDIVNRIHYQWFAYLNEKEILNSDTNIGKYFLLTGHS